MPSGMKLKGLTEMRGKIMRIAEQFPRKTASAINIEFSIELKESQKRTPRKTGDLIASHRLVPASINQNTIRAEITVGNEKVFYAIEVHENLEAEHPVGQAKFLESTLFESRDTMGARIARRVEFNKQWLG